MKYIVTWKEMYKGEVTVPDDFDVDEGDWGEYLDPENAEQLECEVIAADPQD